MTQKKSEYKLKIDYIMLGRGNFINTKSHFRLSLVKQKSTTTYLSSEPLDYIHPTMDVFRE